MADTPEGGLFALGSLADLESLNSPERLSKTIEDLNKRGHAAQAMLTCSQLENWLTSCMEMFFANKSKTLMGKLSAFHGPLGTFSAKIDIAFAVGAISQATRTKLHTLRDIRNEFAHPKGQTLDYDHTVMDPHFNKIALDKWTREMWFLQAAVDCVDDMKTRVRPKIEAEALIQAVRQHQASQVP